jgi:hypothetical protein
MVRDRTGLGRFLAEVTLVRREKQIVVFLAVEKELTVNFWERWKPLAS